MNSLNSVGFTGGFTVLMAVYYRCDAALFDRALSSVYANTLQPDEVLLVVDGPVPELVESVIARYSIEYGMRVLRLPVNTGLANALNQGLSHISPAWVARADQDDINLPQRFEQQARFISNLGMVDIVGSAILEVDTDGTRIAARYVPMDHASIVRYSRRRNPFNHMTVIFRLASVRAVGGYPEIMAQDYGLWALLLGHGCVAANVPEILVHATAGRDMYRRRGGLSNVRSEIPLQRLLVSNGLKSPIAGLVHGLGRAAVSMLPNGMRKLVYEKLLR